MDAIAQMQGWIDRTKTAETELSKLERESKELAEKSENVRAERQSLREQIAEHEQAITALESEDAEAKNRILEAMLSDDVTEERALKQRRKQIAEAVQRHGTEIRGLRDTLDGLEDTEQEAATVAAKLAALDFGYAFGFGSRLRDALVKNELRLKGRRSAARHSLPKYDEDAYRQVRAKLDPKQVERESREQESLNQHHSMREQQQAKKDAAASKEYAGVGAFGGPRRSEPDVRDFGS